MTKRTQSILFVCMGNICRSPVVEAVARTRFARAGFDIDVDSAGTEDYHTGERPDSRSLASARARGYDASTHRARQVATADFERFDRLLVMDRTNLRALLAIAPGEGHDRVAMFLHEAGLATPAEVPDPYYGHAADFERVIDLAEQGVDGLIARFRDAYPKR
jgi:low molecular weight protein-tyrosine phosphatase